jgi:hypothetical protein
MTIAIIIIAAILIAAALAAIYLYFDSRRRRTEELRGRFGPEYDYALSRMGDRGRAEAELAERQKRVEKLDIRQLPETQRREFADRWRDVQARFIDDPATAVNEAHDLCDRVMTARGSRAETETRNV